MLVEIAKARADEKDKLGATVGQQFAKKLRERLEHPRVPAATLHGLHDHYKIKLRHWGYRLVYRVNNDVVTVTVVAVGRRERGGVYETARRG